MTAPPSAEIPVDKPFIFSRRTGFLVALIGTILTGCLAVGVFPPGSGWFKAATVMVGICIWITTSSHSIQGTGGVIPAEPPSKTEKE